MSKSKYPRIKDGEGIEIDIENQEIIRFACCDCGLVHRMAFAIEENGKLGMAVERNNRSTAQLRRSKFGYLQQGKIARWTLQSIRSGDVL